MTAMWSVWSVDFLRWCVVAMVITARTITCLQTTEPLHRLMTKDERLLLFGSDGEGSPYELIHPRYTTHQAKTRSSRSVKENDREIRLNFFAFGETFRLHLKPNPKLLSPAFHVRQESNTSSGEDPVLPVNDCFYHGHSDTHPNSSVALTLCEGVRGLIETAGSTYVINPIPKNVAKRSGEAQGTFPHIILKKQRMENYPCPHKSRRKRYIRPNEVFPVRPHYRSRPQRSSKESSSAAPLTVETAVFVDQALYDVMRRTFPVDTDQQMVTYVLTIMNAVQLLFKQASLGRNIELSIVLMDILKSQPRELTTSDNIDTYLTNFCVWQHNKRLHGRGSSPRWDHALLLSGINMYVVDSQGRKKRHVVGLAPVSGMCNPLNSCTISEGTSFQTVLVAGHEMGHSLGMEHDGLQDGNACTPDSYIMSPTLGAGKTTWSTCSREYLEKFLKTQQARCLLTPSPYVNILQQFGLEKLPGEVYDADQQCSFRFGASSRKSVNQPLEEVCRILRCETANRNAIAFHAHPALEGTKCGRNQWCRSGACVTKDEPVAASTAVDGQWSTWSPYSPCTSDCVARSNSPAMGIMVSTRRCDSPRPQNGGKFCDGNDRRVKLCDPSQMCTTNAIRSTALDEFITETCKHASRRDPTLEPRGTQYPSYDNSHSCYVWCHKRGGGYMTQGWKVPDGTPCWREGRSQSQYCVNGECRSFDCTGYSSEESETKPCPSRPIPIPSIPKITNSWGPWHPVSDCRHSCLTGSRGFRLVSRECNSIAGCSGRKDTFQLCITKGETCRSLQTTEQYANEICQKYRSKYPTLLSGKGRQLPPRPGHPNSACTVACQDRVWQDIHYQMDAFEDGKFPFGTDCSGGNSRIKAYCLNGKCLKFDDKDLPVEDDAGDRIQVDRLFGQNIKKREIRHLISKIDEILGSEERDPPFDDPENGILPAIPPPFQILHPFRLPRLIHFTQSQNSSVWSVEPYVWGMSMTECSAPCGGGFRTITVFCHAGNTVVDDSLCNPERKPRQSGVQACNPHDCTGRWIAEKWTPCSSTCGEGVRTRQVLCVKQSTKKVFSLIEEHHCPLDKPPSEEKCILSAC